MSIRFRNVLLVSLLTWLPAAMANPDWWVNCWKSNNCQSCETGGGKYGPVVDLYKFSWEWDAAAKAYDKAAYEQGLNGKTCQVGMYIPLENADGTLGITESQYKAGSLKFEGVSDAEVQKETIGGQQMPKYVPGDKTATFPHPDTDTNGYGFGVDQYFNDQTTPTPGQGGTVQTCAKPGDDVKPLTESTCGMPRYNEGQEPPPIGVLDIVTSKPHPMTGEMIAKSVRYTAPVGSPSWKIEWFDGNTKTATSVLKPHKVEEITRLQMKTGHGQTEKVRRVTKLAAAPGQDPTQVQSDVTETHAFYKFGSPVVLEREVHHGNGQPDTTTTWTYFTNPNDPVSFNKPATMRSSTGAWANYSYQGSEVTGSVLTKIITPWLDSPAPAVGTAPDESTCRVVTTLEALKETGTFFREEKVLGQVVASMSGERFKEGNILVERIKEKTGTGPDLVTTRRGFANNELVSEVERGRLQSVTRSDGTVEKYSHKKSGSNRVEVIERGTGTAGGVTAGTKIESTYSQRDYLLEQKTSDIGCAMPLDTRTAIGFDYYGNPMKWAHDNDPSDYRETTPGCCCGPERERNRDGSVTDHLYDPNKRPVMERNTCGNRVVTDTFGYDTTGGGMPRITETTVASGVEGSVVKTTVKDLGGRPVSITKPGPMGAPETTGYAYSADERITTQTNPDGGTIITETYLDGQIKSVTGTATIAKTYSYSVHNENGGGLVTTITTAGGVGGSVSSYNDLMGRAFKSTRTAPHGKTAVTLTTYNAKGQAEVITSSGQPAVKYLYNDEGERIATWTDRNGDGAFNDATVNGVRDACTTSQTDYLVGANAPAGLGDCRRTITTVRTESNEDMVISTTWQSVDGLRSRQETLGVAGASTSVQTRPMLGAASGTQTNPDGTSTVTATEILANGNTRGMAIRKDANGNAIETSETISDAAGRPIQTVNGRGHVTQYSYHSAGGQLASTTQVNAAPGGGNLVTNYAHTVTSGTGTLVTTTLPDGSHQYQETNLLGQTVRQWGSQTNPVSFTYDAAGRRATLTTYRAPVGANADTFPTITGDTTTWTYDPSGVLLQKTYSDGKGTAYGYDVAGKLTTRTWARGIVTAYSYTAGQVTGIDYSDSTPDVASTYNRLGQLTSATQSGGPNTPDADITFGYNPASLRFATETITIDADGSAGALPSLTRTLDRSRDALQRPTGYDLKTDNLTLESSIGYGYDVSGRIASISASGLPNLPGKSHAFEYSYIANSNLIDKVTGPVHEVDNDYEANRNVLLQKKNTRTVGTAGELSIIGYGVNAIGQRVLRNLSGEIRAEFYGGQSTDLYATNWGYDALGQVIGEDKPDTDADRGYGYDQIGNRLTSSADSVTTSYTSNSLNQYSQISVPSVQSVVPTHDLDGNMTFGLLNGSSTGQFEYDAANQLVRTQSTATSDPTRYAYDAFGRRVAKVTYPNAGGTATVATVFIYDGWNLIGEYKIDSGAWTLERTYAWGTDLSGSPQGAGGVGGLLAVSLLSSVSGASVFFPLYDGNGNIDAYLDANGVPAAIYQYDAFGNVLRGAGKGAAIEQAKFSHRFSTKYQDAESGLLYFGYRYYAPLTGRWPSRDQLGEVGGYNLYAFVGNDGVDQWDLLGLTIIWMQKMGSDSDRQEKTTMKTKTEIDDYVEFQKDELGCCWRVETRVFTRYHKYVTEYSDIFYARSTWRDAEENANWLGKTATIAGVVFLFVPAVGQAGGVVATAAGGAMLAFSEFAKMKAQEEEHPYKPERRVYQVMDNTGWSKAYKQEHEYSRLRSTGDSRCDNPTGRSKLPKNRTNPPPPNNIPSPFPL